MNFDHINTASIRLLIPWWQKLGNAHFHPDVSRRKHTWLGQDIYFPDIRQVMISVSISSTASS